VYLVNRTYYDGHSGDPDATISVFLEKEKIIYLFMTVYSAPFFSPDNFILHFFPPIFDNPTIRARVCAVSDEKTETKWWSCII